MPYDRQILKIGVNPTENPSEYHRRYYHLVTKGRKTAPRSWVRGKNK